jgi:hypothetical protein
VSDGPDPLSELRAILRPLTAALTELRARHDRAGELATEAERLASVAEQLIRAAGLQHLLSASSATPERRDDADQRVVDAFASAHAGWADLINGLESLARAQLEAAGTPEEAGSVERLAVILESFGQSGPVAAIRRAIPHRNAEIAEVERVFAESQAQFERLIRRKEAVEMNLAGYTFSNEMSESEIRNGLSICRSLLQNDGDAARLSVSLKFFDLYMSIRHWLYGRYGYDKFDAISSDGEVFFRRQQSLAYDAPLPAILAHLTNLDGWFTKIY